MLRLANLTFLHKLPLLGQVLKFPNRFALFPRTHDPSLKWALILRMDSSHFSDKAHKITLKLLQLYFSSFDRSMKIAFVRCSLYVFKNLHLLLVPVTW